MSDAAILRALSDVLDALARNASPDEVLARVTSVPLALPLTEAAALLRRPDGVPGALGPPADGLVVVGTTGPDAASIDALERAATEPGGPVAEAVAAVHVAASPTMVASPIVAEGTVVGALVLGVTAEPQWSVDDLAVLSAMSSALGLCMTRDASRGSQPGPGTPVLTPRQAAIMRRVSQGRSNAAIGVQLRVSESTVKQEVRRVSALLHAPGRAAAARRAGELGLLDDA